jgi:hypothetical protein
MAFLATIVLTTSAACAEAKLEGTRPAQWRLVWTSDPAHEAQISWSTLEAGSLHAVTFRSEDGSQQGRATAQANGPYAGSGGRLHYHHATLRELTPKTKYRVVIDSDGNKSPELWFMTAPEEHDEMSLIFGGDSRTGRDARRNVNRMIARQVEKYPSILAFAHGGDYVASGSSLSNWSAWLSDHELTVTADGRVLPIIPARGNHDRGKLFNQVFGFPEGDLNYYEVDLGPQLRLITLNTNIDAGGNQRKWLAKSLAAARSQRRWVVVQYHRPAYPAVKQPGRSRTEWVPLFERYGVDLVCEADGHVIKRTVPIRNDRPDPDGIVYIGEGGLGVNQRHPRTDLWYLRRPGMASRGHHFQLLTFTPDWLTCKVVMLGGEIRDTYRRAPRQ